MYNYNCIIEPIYTSKPIVSAKISHIQEYPYTCMQGLPITRPEAFLQLYEIITRMMVPVEGYLLGGMDLKLFPLLVRRLLGLVVWFVNFMDVIPGYIAMYTSKQS